MEITPCWFLNEDVLAVGLCLNDRTLRQKRDARMKMNEMSIIQNRKMDWEQRNELLWCVRFNGASLGQEHPKADTK